MKQKGSQECFFKALIDQEMPVTVFLTNGVKLQGIIIAVDEHVLLLQREGLVQLIYKHAVSTVMPVRPISVQA